MALHSPAEFRYGRQPTTREPKGGWGWVICLQHQGPLQNPEIYFRKQGRMFGQAHAIYPLDQTAARFPFLAMLDLLTTPQTFLRAAEDREPRSDVGVASAARRE